MTLQSHPIKLFLTQRRVLHALELKCHVQIFKANKGCRLAYITGSHTIQVLLSLSPNFLNYKNRIKIKLDNDIRSQ